MKNILEDINSKLDFVLEGISTFDTQLETFRQETNEKFDHQTFLIEALIKKVDNNTDEIKTISENLNAHRAGTETHSRC